MQQKKATSNNKHHRRHTENHTQFSKDKSISKYNSVERVRLRSIQTQQEKKKFAQQYAKLTKQFRNILARNSSHDRSMALGSHRYLKQMQRQPSIQKQKIHTGNTDQNTKDKQVKNNIPNITATQRGFKRSNKWQRNQKIQNLYNNRLHIQIMETASKIQRNRRQKLNTTHNVLSPKAHGILSPISPAPQTNQSLVSQQIYIHLQKQKQLKINTNFKNIPQILAHFHNLYKIRQLVDDYKNNYANMIKNIRRYIMNHNKADVNKLQNLLKQDRQKQKLRLFLCVEKIAVVGLLDSMIRQCQISVRNQGRIALDAIMGVYYSTFSYIITQQLYKPGSNDKQVSNQHMQYRQSIQACLDLLEAQSIQKRKDLESTTQFIYKKAQNLYKYNQSLFHKIKEIFTQITKIPLTSSSAKISTMSSFSRSSSTQSNLPSNVNVNVNRFFYYLLSQYARNLNIQQNMQILKIHKNMLDFFCTCPAPHLAYTSPHRITVVIQFQGVLASIKSTQNVYTQNLYKRSQAGKPSQPICSVSSMAGTACKQMSIKLRPYTQQLISHLCRICEVVLITSLMPQNIRVSGSGIGRTRQSSQCGYEYEYEQIFKLSSCILFRYHYVRCRGSLIKDMGRLGRKMENVVMIDCVDYSNAGGSASGKNVGNSGSDNSNISNTIINTNTNTGDITLQQLQKQIQKQRKDNNRQQINNTNVNIGNTNSTGNMLPHLYTQNTIPISTWRGNAKDQQLIYLRQLLHKIITEDPTDVRTSLANYRLNYNLIVQQNHNQNQHQPKDERKDGNNKQIQKQEQKQRQKQKHGQCEEINNMNQKQDEHNNINSRIDINSQQEGDDQNYINHVFENIQYIDRRKNKQGN